MSERAAALGAAEVRCSRCQRVVGATLNERTERGLEMRVVLSDPPHGLRPPITCPDA